MDTGSPKDSFCEICGDTGGAMRMVLCENADLGCLGGIHLYCCFPVLTEPPTEAWYCSECRQAHVKAAARWHRETAKRGAKRAAAADMRRKEREEAKRQRRQQREEQLQLKKQQGDRKQETQQKQQMKHDNEQHQQELQQTAQPPPQQQEEAGRSGPILPQPSAGPPARPLSTAISAALSRSGASRGRSSGATQRTPGDVAASGRTVLPTGQVGQPPAQRRESHPAAGGVTVAKVDTLALLFESLKKDDETSKQQAQAMGRVVDGTSRRLVRSTSEQEQAQKQLQAQHTLSRCMAEGLKAPPIPLLLPSPYQAGLFEASLLCYAIPGNPHGGTAAQRLRPLADAAKAGQQPVPRLMSMDELGLRQDQAWREACLLLALAGTVASQQQQQQQLWAMLCQERQAVNIPLPATAAEVGTEGLEPGDGTSAEGMFLALVPNLFDHASFTFFGLLALPIPRQERPSASGCAPQRSILRRAAAAEHQPLEAPAGEALSDAAGRLKAGGTRRFPVAWADAGQADETGVKGLPALELGVGAHYGTPRRALQASRPQRLPSIRAFLDESSSVSKPLEGLRVAIVGFDVTYEGTLRRKLYDLRSLGASTYTKLVVVADVLCLPPRLLRDGLERSAAFPLGFAHLLSTCAVRVYGDTGLNVLDAIIGHQQRLQHPDGLAGFDWLARHYGLVFPAGLLVILDLATLQSMQANQLTQVLKKVQRLAAESSVRGCLWCVAAAPLDLDALRVAAIARRTPAAENWQVWQQQGSIARPLTIEEMSSSSNPGDPLPLVKHAVKSAKVHLKNCRLVYLCSTDEETLRQAENQNTILSGNVEDLIAWLKSR